MLTADESAIKRRQYYPSGSSIQPKLPKVSERGQILRNFLGEFQKKVILVVLLCPNIENVVGIKTFDPFDVMLSETICWTKVLYIFLYGYFKSGSFFSAFVSRAIFSVHKKLKAN